jgi:hypothetical protein
MRKLLCLAIAPLVLGGCQSEVDKCVAQWEKANPHESNDYCRPLERDENGKCYSWAAQTREQVLVEARMLCMQASNGK